MLLPDFFYWECCTGKVFDLFWLQTLWPFMEDNQLTEQPGSHELTTPAACVNCNSSTCYMA
jgi:hypothetical protein